MKTAVSLIYLFVCAMQTMAQHWETPKPVYQAGLVLQIGTRVTAIGLTANIGLPIAFTQWNGGAQLKYNLHSYGARRQFWEARLALGLLLLGGKRDLQPDFHFDGLNHQTAYHRAIGYNYLWYFDRVGTTQRSGGWSIHEGAFSLLFENDVFGGQARDRFRTGILQLNYRTGDFKLFTQWYIWTGETRGSTWNKEPMPGCPNGYRDLEALPYGRTSHGIWSFGAHYNPGYMQVVTVKTGYDSEQVRHIFQNRLSHDLILLPKTVKRHTPHYPRLNSAGKPIFTKAEKRPTRFYFQIGANQSWSE